MIRLVIPEPPSVNEMRASVNGRLISTSIYRRWLALARADLRNVTPMGRGPFRVEISVARKCRKDVDNIIKPVLDLLQKADVIENDRHVHDVRAFRGDGEETTVTIEVINDT